MMKKIIFMVIAILIATNAYAQKEYTDYDFIGYTHEQKENDEFYKYEEVSINKFYKLVEKNVDYKECNEEYTQQFIDKNDIEVDEFLSTNNSLALPHERMLMIRADDNYLTHKLTITGLKEYQKIDKIEVIGFNGITTTLEKEEILENFTIEFMRTYLESIQIKFYYETNTPIEFQLSIINDSGLTRVTRQITLSNGYNKLTINSRRDDHYNQFLEEYGFEGLNEVVYNKYQRIYYKVYDLEKVYYKDSEETEIEGYTYDKEESITMYKIYKREKLPFKEELPTVDNPSNTEPPIQELPNEGSTTQNSSQETAQDELLNNDAIPTNTLQITSTTKKKKTTTTTHNIVQEVSTSDEEITKRIEAENLGKTYETTDNSSKTNLVEYKSSGLDSTSCDCRPKVNSFTVIGLIMIIASLIITGIHYYNVNYRDE